MNNNSGLIFDISRFSVHDGPGIRTTVFLKGCPLNCRWCHNPEGIDKKPQVIYKSDRCIRCGACVENCAQNAINQDNDFIVIADRCNACGDCVEVCNSEALELAGTKYTPEELMREIIKDIDFYTESGGGITFSGGEPLMQEEFLREANKLCKSESLHTALDTTGYYPDQLEFVDICSEFDLVLYDLKLINEDKHLEYTGVSNAEILSNLRRLSSVNTALRIRFPLIPEVNDSEVELKDLAEFVNSLERRIPVDLLPYHSMAKEKWKNIGLQYKLIGTPSATDELVEKTAEYLAQLDIDITIGG